MGPILSTNMWVRFLPVSIACNDQGAEVVPSQSPPCPAGLFVVVKRTVGMVIQAVVLDDGLLSF